VDFLADPAAALRRMVDATEVGFVIGS
jgi:hypothetical protein